MVFTRLVLAVGIGVVGYWFWNAFLAAIAASGKMKLVLSIAILGILVAIVTTIIYWFAYRSFRQLYVRLMGILKNRRARKKESA